MKCPHCGSKDLIAKTINTDEDAFCEDCEKLCFMHPILGILVKENPRLISVRFLASRRVRDAR